MFPKARGPKDIMTIPEIPVKCSHQRNWQNISIFKFVHFRRCECFPAEGSIERLEVVYQTGKRESQKYNIEIVCLRSYSLKRNTNQGLSISPN